MGRILSDVRHSLRVFARNPGFAATVIVTLTLGIGVTTSVFSIFNGVLLRPLTYPHPEELVRVYDTQPACNTCPASFPKFHDWKSRSGELFSAIGGATQQSFTLTGDGDPVQVRASLTTATLPHVLQVQPQKGRWYTTEEDQPGGPKLAVVSYDFWTRQLASAPNVIGRKLLLNGEPYEVIGLMPATFSFGRADLYVPIQRKLDPSTRGNHFMPVYARLKKGVTLERATREMRAIGESLAKEFGHNHGVDVQSYMESIVGFVRKPLNFLLGAVFLLLLIACANVANLLLASGLARQRELAVRMALGASPRDLGRQLATEGVLLALAGGAFGVLLSQWIVSTFMALAANQLPRATAIETDLSVLLFTAVISLGVGLFCSLWPIVLLCRKDLARAVREGDARGGSQSGRKIGSGLVVAEMALAFALLASSGLLVKNLFLLTQRDAGFRTDRILTFSVSPTGVRYQADGASTVFYRELYSRLKQVNDVDSLGFTSHLPMLNFGWNGEFQIEGGVPWDARSAPLVEYRWFYGDYLKTIGVPLLKGRLLDEHDGAGTRTVLINKAMADKFWPDKDPIGRKFGQGKDLTQWYEVVGVVGNMRSAGFERNSLYEFYRNIEQSSFGAMTVVIRTKGADPKAVTSVARQIVNSIDPALPLTQIQTFEQVVGDSVGQPRLMSALTGLFGGLAGLLAMVGIYSVMAYNVRRQRREFGVRIALGADRPAISKLVLGRGMVLSVIGVAIGAFGAWSATGLLQSLLNDVKPTDPIIFVGTAVMVLVVGMLASYLPARSAARVDPMIVLRTE